MMKLLHRDDNLLNDEILNGGLGSTPLVTISILLSFLFVAVTCFYCLYPRPRKKSFADDDEDSRSSTSAEHRNINNKKVPDASDNRTRRISHWTRITSYFHTASATDELNYRLRSANPTHGPRSGNSSSVQETSPLGEVRTSYVQPQSRDGNHRPNSSAATPVQQRSSFMPEAFRQTFEPWLAGEENKSPPQGAEDVGQLEFSVAYDFDPQRLVVRIIKAKGLPAMDLNGSSDPFVKCCLLPDRKRKLETKIRRKNLNPVWEESLVFEGLPYEKIRQRVLYMQVMDFDRFSRNDPIGEILIPLHQIDLTDSQAQWEYLTPCRGSNKRGELLISLCYHPVEGRIEVEIKEARNLKPMDIGGASDPYVKIWLRVRGKKMVKKKTITVKNSLNPTFNEKFDFSLPMERLREIQLEVSVMDKDTIGRNEIIGKIYIGMKSNSLERKHWKEMLTKIRQPVEQWHVLKV